MKTDLKFEEKETKKLLSNLDYNYFLKRNFEEENYNESDISELYNSYETSLSELRKKFSTTKKQANFFLEGKVRKMFTGGFLPALFQLDEGRSLTLSDFKGIGNDLAYFTLWQKYYKRKVTSEKIWDVTVKIGSFLGIVLAIIKLLETFFKK